MKPIRPILILTAVVLLFANAKLAEKTEVTEPIVLDASGKEMAFQVLETRCNSCHRIQNPRRVFTLDNMDPYAPKIYKQVFEKQRMPKGKNNKLTQAESQTLRNWLNSLGIQ